jgi:hypothetical protein
MDKKDQGSIRREGGGLIKWYDVDLFPFDDLESSDGSCVGLDGQVRLLARGRLGVTTADQFARGPADG